MRKSLWIILAVLLVAIGFVGAAKADDDFTFSFTNTLGNTAGTVTGEILGLTDNATSAATQVIIDGYPAAFDVFIGDPPIDATAWTVDLNQFTESSGAITSATFKSTGPGPSGLDLNFFSPCAPNPQCVFNELFAESSDPSAGSALLGGLAHDDPITFAPLTSPVPEPGTGGLMLIGIGSLGLMAVVRKHRAMGRRCAF
jgi:PEP-CTERM motif-containing protein